MRSTIALSQTRRVIVYPNKIGGVTLETGRHDEPVFLTIHQALVLTVALQQAAREAFDINQSRADTGARATAHQPPAQGN